MDDFFHYVSKGVIIIPIVIIILSLIFKFNQNQRTVFPNFPSPTLTISPAIKKTLGIDLDNSWICDYKIDDKEYQLLINKGKISLEATVSGQIKKYDLTPYSSIINNLLKMDVDQLKSISKSYLPQGVDFNDLIKSCKKL